MSVVLLGLRRFYIHPQTRMLAIGNQRGLKHEQCPTVGRRRRSR
jgi:hypothetical protein